MKIETKFDIDEVVIFNHPKFGLLEAKVVDISIVVYNGSSHKPVILYRLFANYNNYCDFYTRHELTIQKMNNSYEKHNL